MAEPCPLLHSKLGTDSYEFIPDGTTCNQAAAEAWYTDNGYAVPDDFPY